MIQDRLAFAMKEDTAVLTSLLGYLDMEREKILESLSKCSDREEIYRLQGEARGLTGLRHKFAEMGKVKDGEADQPGISQNRRSFPRSVSAGRRVP